MLKIGCVNMEKQELVSILNKTAEIKKLLTPMGGSFVPDLKTLYRKTDFLNWKEELKHQLHKLKQNPLIIEILQLLEEGFQTGFTDEQDFDNLQVKLNVLSSHLDEYCEERNGENKVVSSKKLKKGTTIKTAFDEYTLIKQVGSGGNGRVFSANNRFNG